MTPYAILIMLILNSAGDILSADNIQFETMEQCEREAYSMLQFYNVKTKCVWVDE